MTHSHEQTGSVKPARRPFIKSPAGIAVAMGVLIAAFYLLREHWQHVGGSWPYLLLLACPVMHLFHGHGGHGGHHQHGAEVPADPAKKSW